MSPIRKNSSSTIIFKLIRFFDAGNFPNNPRATPPGDVASEVHLFFHASRTGDTHITHAVNRCFRTCRIPGAPCKNAMCSRRRRRICSSWRVPWTVLQKVKAVTLDSLYMSRLYARRYSRHPHISYCMIMLRACVNGVARAASRSVVILLLVWRHRAAAQMKCLNKR